MRAQLRWLFSAGLLGLAAVLIGRLVGLVWVPCAGEPTADGFSEACLAAMDTVGPIPISVTGSTTADVPGAVMILAMAAAWAVLVPGLTVSRRAKAVAAVPALLMAWPAVGSLAGMDAWALGGLVLLLLDAAVLAVLLVLWGSGITGARWFRHAVVLVAATALSFVHQIGEYGLATSLNDASWDTPPGTGRATVVWLAVAAAITAGWALADLWRARRPARWDEAPSAAPARVA